MEDTEQRCGLVSVSKGSLLKIHCKAEKQGGQLEDVAILQVRSKWPEPG